MKKTFNIPAEKMVSELIKFFGIAPVSTALPVDMKTYEKFATLGFKSGYYIHPACCTDEVYEFLENATYNPNATFWKTWEDVIARSETELFFAQAIHYATTYGSNFTLPAYVPNSNYPEAIFSNLKAILPATDEEIAEKCYEMLQSGIALSTDVTAVFVTYIVNALNKNIFSDFDLNSIKNKEGMCMLSYHMNIMPINPSEMVRALVYMATEQTLLIKSREVISTIKSNANYINLDEIISDDDMKRLASVFYRFKPILLAFKKNPKNAAIINKLRKLAVKYHKPMKANVFESILDSKWSDADVKNAIKNETNIFKLLRAYSYLTDEYNLPEDEYNKTYVIRNSKTYVRHFVTNTSDSTNRKKIIETYIKYAYNKIVAMVMKYRIINNHTTVRLPKDIVLAFPVSEKQFVGNIPFGSYMHMTAHNYFGVYWRNEWGTKDYDLSYCSFDGRIRYGWNSFHKSDNDDVVFSGDMTYADPEAVEMFYCKNTCPDGLLYLNRFNGNPGSQARLFFGNEEISTLTQNYMVNPDTIKVNADIFPQKRETIVGAFIDNKAYFFNMERTNLAVSSTVTDHDSIQRKVDSYLMLHDILEMAGYEIIYENNVDKEPDVDFSNYTKDELINFLTDIVNC